MNSYAAVQSAKPLLGAWVVEWWQDGVFRAYIVNDFATLLDAQFIVLELTLEEMRRHHNTPAIRETPVLMPAAANA